MKTKMGTLGRVLIATGLVIPMGCEHRGAEPVTIAELRAEMDPVEEVWGPRIRTTDDGLPRLQIDAAVMRKYQTDDSTYVILEGDSAEERVLVRLFDEEGHPSAVIRANQVIRREDADRFQARGRVDVVTAADKRLSAEELRWVERDRTIRSSGFVRIQTATEDIQGYELEADESLDTYRLQRVTGRAIISED